MKKTKKKMKSIKKIKKMNKTKKKFFFSSIEMIDINADTHAKNCVYTIKVVKKRQ